MPFYDGTGPRGRGPMTGRGMGYCGYGRGWFDRGFRGGFSRFWGRAPSVEDQKRDLANYKRELEEELKEIKREEERLSKEK